MLANPLGHEKLCILRPAVTALGEAYLLFAEGLAMSCAGVLLVRGAKADVAIDDDEGRHIGAGLDFLNRLRQAFDVVDIADPLNVPTVGEKSRGDVVAECEIRVSFDRDAVAVIDPAEVAQHLMAGEGCGFARHAFHHVAIPADGEHAIVEDGIIGTIEMLTKPSCSQSHAHAVAAALAQGSRGGLHACGPTIFRVAGTRAIELSEAFDIVERDSSGMPSVREVDRSDAGEM